MTPPRHKLLTLALLFVATSLPAAPSGARANEVAESANEFSESGKASYYSDKFQNRKTASGERYQHDLKTAAHKKLPFGSLVQVTNLKNGKSVVVKINDRGPFVKGRVIDLSKSAFDHIGDTSRGLIGVKIEVIR